MTVLGKILAIFNVLMAIAFLCLAAADWGKRQAWSYAVYRHDLYLNGLPVDAQELDSEGNPLVDLLSPGTLNQVFQQAGGAPVRTQAEEVERRYNQLKQDIESAQGPAQRQKLREVLLPLQETGDERSQLERQIQTAKVEDLMGSDGPFEKAFRAAREGKDPQGQPLEYAPRRHAIAHLLFNLSKEPTDFQRTITVTGLKAYTGAVEEHAANVREIAEGVKLAMADDRAHFEVNHKQILRMIEVEAERVAELQLALQNYQALIARHQQLVQARRADVAELTKQLATAKEETQAALAAQEKLEKELFVNQRALGTAQETNERLEREIRTVELGR